MLAWIPIVKPASLSKSARHITLASAMLLMAGCVSPKPKPTPPHPHPTSQCPAKYPQHFADATQGYSICLPANVSKGSASGFPAGTVVFNGFTVPAGTNLTRKQLVIQPGVDDNLQGATPFGQFTVDGVTFQRAMESDAGAGHRALHIIYTRTHAGKKLNFDFGHYSVNPQIVGPPHPAEFNQAAQIKITEEIMKTFRRLH